MLNVMFATVMIVFIFVYMAIIISADEKDRERRDCERRSVEYIKNSRSKPIIRKIKDKDDMK